MIEDVLPLVVNLLSTSPPIISKTTERLYVNGHGFEVCSRCSQIIHSEQMMFISTDSEGEYYTHEKCEVKI